ncbi:hypothetical protein F4779DRAFT_633914 [Xylariaceae sp. FL0662B]|nr:hypothetical protein F4779DRAFT_633914 [Xylariaceae sp. FL0662B]
MQRSFCDGMSVGGSSSSISAFDARQNCTTQSTGGGADLANIDSYYIPPKAPETTHPLYQPHPSTFPISVNTCIQPYRHPQTRSASSSSQGMILTPPSETYEGDEFDCYSYHGSPAAASQGHQPVHTYTSLSPEQSPDHWSPPGGQQLAFHQAPPRDPEHLQALGIQHFASLPYEHQFPHNIATSPYENPTFDIKPLDTDPMAHQVAPSMIPDFPEPGPSTSPHVESPRVKEETGISHQYGDEETREGVKAEPSDGDGGNKEDEPYAQLIHKAFLSRERHAMSLQEIYQWFRENTEKAKSENKGWQNSIRHNLSMNAAFVKRDRKPSPGDPVTSHGEPKKATEWVLEEWAVHGVQSTTRYRKGNSGRRGGPGSHTRAANLSARANSGRKGGITASRTKAAAASRRAMFYRHDSPGFLGSHQGHLHGNIYNQPLAFQYHDTPREAPMTPEPSASDMMLVSSLPSTGLSVNDNSQGFTYGNNLNYGESQQSYNPGSAIFSMEAVTGVYHGHPAPDGGRVQVATTGVQPDLSAMFAGNMRGERVPFAYWNEPATGGSYQP